MRIFNFNISRDIWSDLFESWTSYQRNLIKHNTVGQASLFFTKRNSMLAWKQKKWKSRVTSKFWIFLLLDIATSDKIKNQIPGNLFRCFQNIMKEMYFQLKKKHSIEKNENVREKKWMYCTKWHNKYSFYAGNKT